jgi:hypothetical protein
VSFLGFVIAQVIFAHVARSQAMLADSIAMAVDAATYLFNMVAEKAKGRPCTAAEMLMSEPHRLHRREVQRHIAEVVPPALSVGALAAVACLTVRDAAGTLLSEGRGGGTGADVNLTIMLVFSSVNLLLDAVNVGCFALAGTNVFGLENLNMCSAWTVRHQKLGRERLRPRARASRSNSGLTFPLPKSVAGFISPEFFSCSTFAPTPCAASPSSWRREPPRPSRRSLLPGPTRWRRSSFRQSSSEAPHGCSRASSSRRLGLSV